MADRYWVGGSGNWDATSTANWSTSSGGSAGASAPTSADNVIFDAGSNTGTNAFTVTVTGTSSAPAVCNDFSTGGAGGALDGVMTLTFATSGNLDVYGSMTLPATNFTWTGATGSLLNFRATTTGKTFTTNGVTLTLQAVFFNGVGGEWTLGSALTTSTNGVTVSAGSFVTANYNITSTTFQATGTGIKTISLGSSTLTLSGSTPIVFSGSNITLNAGTSTITCSAASPTFSGGGLTFYNVSFTSNASGTTTITGANTFNDLSQTSRSADGIRVVSLSANQTVSGTLTLGAANTAVRRILVASDTIGTQRTITLNGTLATLADVDFRNINAAGTVATPWTGTRLGDALGNSNITFDAPKTVYWNLAGSQNWSAIGWATTNNGSPAVNNFPLAQDTATFTEAGSAGTVTINASWSIGSIQMADGVSNRTTAFTLATGANNPQFYGSLTFFSNLTWSGTGTIFFYGQATTQTITSAGVSFTQPITIESPNGTVQLLDNTTVSNTVTLTAGTLDLNDFDLTCTVFSSSNSNTRSIDFGTGQIDVTGNNTTVWTISIATNFSYTGTPTVNFTYAGSTGTRNIVGNGPTTGATESNALNYNITAGTDIIGFNSTRQHKNINFTGFAGTLTNVAITVYGNLTYSSGMTLTAGTSATTFAATSGTQQITTAGKTLDFPITKDGAGTLELQDNLTMGSTRTFTLTAGTLDLTKGGTANLTLSCGLFNSNNSNTRAIAFGTGQIDVTGNNSGVWNNGAGNNLTFTGTPTINSTYAGSTGTRTFTIGIPSSVNQFSLNISAGSDIIAIGSGSLLNDLNFTGFSGTLNNNTRTIYGNLVFSSGMTLVAGANAITFAATSGTQQITTNGVTLDFPITINGVGGTVRLEDNLTMGLSRTLTLANGTFNANDKNVTCGSFVSSNSNTRTLSMGSGTWLIDLSGTSWNIGTSTGMTLNRGTSTITMTSTLSKTFAGGSLTYYKLNQGGTGTLTLTGANTFYDMTNTVQPCTITFPASTTTSFSNFNVKGTSGNLVSLRSSTPGTRYTLAKVA